jgi:hypothetical protein
LVKEKTLKDLSRTIAVQIAIDFKTGLKNRTCKWVLESCCEFDTWSCLSILKLIMTIRLPVIVTKLRRPRINFIKLFFFIAHEKARMFTPGRPSHHNLMFANKAECCTFHVLHSGVGTLPCRKHRTRLESVARSKHSSFLSEESVTKKKSFIRLRPVVNVIILFLSVIYGFSY